jgi:DNA-binding NtrC family response regulator
VIEPERKQILVVDDELNLRRVLSAQLTRDGYDVHTAEDGEQGLKMLAEHHIDLVITDLRMPKVDGMQLLRRAIEIDPDLPVVMLTAHGTVDNAVEALKTGAFDYITKPFDQEEVRAIVRKALKTRELSAVDATRTIGDVKDERFRYGIIGQDASIQQLYALLDRVADTPTTVLVTGESGTGKQLVAHALHESSSRRAKPFIKVNCAAIPKDLLESELLGYEKGAFPGAVSTKPGRFELASGGTLFLDDVDAIPLDMQVRLLRVLSENELERIGGIQAMPLDVRLIAATHVDLKRAALNGEFREDLYYRLAVLPIRLPPLRERADDTIPLAQHFVKKFAFKLKKHVNGIAPQVERVLREYSWPGNIRELENVIERAVLFCDTDRLELGDLPPELELVSADAASAPSTPESTLDGLKEQVKAATAQLERELIQKALKQTHGNVTHAARLLKISRKGMQLKMKELGLRERDERGES